jgi:hypothetical protein
VSSWLIRQPTTDVCSLGSDSPACAVQRFGWTLSQLPGRPSARLSGAHVAFPSSFFLGAVYIGKASFNTVTLEVVIGAIAEKQIFVGFACVLNA